MIIKDRSSFSWLVQLQRLLTGLAILGGITLLGIVGVYLITPNKKGELSVVECGAESRFLDGTKWVFTNDMGQSFRYGHTQSEEFARSGRYSSKISGENLYGMYYRMEEVRPGDHYYATVWRKRTGDFPGALVVNIQGEEDFYLEDNITSEVDDEGWERLELVFTVPAKAKNAFAAVYVYGSGLGAVYFDDFRLVRISRDRMLTLNSRSDTAFSHLNLFVDDNGIRKLQKLRDEALENTILVTGDDSWVKGKIIQGDTALPVRLRLKGDWTDHLRSDKWSFRIQVKEPFAWNRLITFSVQNPQARYYLHEWIFHQFLNYEDVLSTRYDFITLTLNNQSKGVYAIEEHFEKHLPEFRSRREGPILKLSEEGVWASRKRRNDYQHASELEDEMNTYEASEIVPFGEKETLADTTLRAQFETARTLFHQFKYGTKPASEVFDVDILGKYYAIVDICRAYHNIIWHNLRFYYNPVTSRLEPIGFDGYSEAGYMRYSHRPLLGMIIRNENDIFKNKIHSQTFKDSRLVEKYLYYLNKFSDETYLRAFLLEIRERLNQRQSLVQPEGPNYLWTDDLLLERGLQVQALLRPLDDAGMMTYTQSRSGDSVKLKLLNTHTLPLKLTGFGRNGKTLSYPLDTPVYFSAFERSQVPEFEDISAPAGADFVFFQVPGLEEVYSRRISPWALPAPKTSRQNIFTDRQPQTNQVYIVENDRIIFRQGSHEVNTDIVIPEGYDIEFLPGTNIDLVQGASFIAGSPVFMHGDSERPVIIRSSDGSGGGFTVLQSEKPSQLNYVRFEGLNTLQKQGWNLTGAVTFYESDVKIYHSVFTHNHCEDALNIIRSEFELNYSLISHTFADGLDVDFCTGTVKGCRFEHAGNDGADFSGSQVFIVDSEVNTAGDKGVSVGENAVVMINGLTISGAKTGLASKDLSQVRIDTIAFENCQTAFAAYRKKSEFGGGKIQVKAYSIKNVKFEKQIEPGSTLKTE